MNQELFKSAVIMSSSLLAEMAHKAKHSLPKDTIHNTVVGVYRELERAQQTLRAQSATPHVDSAPSPAGT